jgi:hypothetical protein
VEDHDEEAVVRCAECEEPIITDRRPLDAETFGDWLVDLTEYYEHLLRREAEQAKVREAFARRQAEGFLSQGETKAYKDRMKELE